jgi:reactive intermediate/imine deaminase
VTIKSTIETDKAPKAIGTYSQAVRVDNTVYLSGQIPLNPHSMILGSDNFNEQAHQVFLNLKAVCEAAGGDLDCIVKLTVYLTDLGNFPLVNDVMSQYFQQPFPARAAVGISELPRGAQIEADGIMIL